MKLIHALAIGAIAAMIGCCSPAVAGSNQSIITGYFDGGTVPGKQKVLIR
jgi:hypothetical protein